MKICKNCKVETEFFFFLRQNYKAAFVSVVKKWQSVGAGYCMDCAKAAAKKLDEKKGIEGFEPPAASSVAQASGTFPVILAKSPEN